MYKQLCKMSIPETKRSLHNMTSKLKKNHENAIFCHFIDFRPIWACPYVINMKIYNF